MHQGPYDSLNSQLVTDVVRQLCLNLAITESPVLFALRDEQDQLVTDENMRRHIKDRTNLKLGLAF